MVLSFWGRSTTKLSQGDEGARLGLILWVDDLILAVHVVLSLVTQVVAVCAEGLCFETWWLIGSEREKNKKVEMAGESLPFPNSL